MLLDCLAYTEQESSELRIVLARRRKYLKSRARAVAEGIRDQDLREREQGDGIRDRNRRRRLDREARHWPADMAEATLWMEAAECAAALADVESARQSLRRAIDLLLGLELPLGAALQRAFAIEDEGLASRADKVIKSWRERLRRPLPSRDEDSDGDRGLLASAVETAQQWAYVVLAEAGNARRWILKPEDHDLLHGLLGGVAAAPVGRLRLPIDSLRALAEAASTVRTVPGFASLFADEAAEVIAKALSDLYRSLQSARASTYLWRRMLAPVPLFDLDTALLIALAQNSGRADVFLAPARQLPKESGDYARAFIDVVEGLRLRPNDESGDLSYR